MLILISMLVLIAVLLDITPVQNYIAHRAASILAGKLKTKVAIRHVRIDFLNRLALQGVYIEGQAHDTLLYAGEAEIRITDWFIFKDKPVLQYLSLSDAYVHLYRTPVSPAWNYDFIADAFASKDTVHHGGNTFDLDLKKVSLSNVRLYMDDPWGGEDMDYDIGSLMMDANNIDLKKSIIDLQDISISHCNIALLEVHGAKPDSLRHPDTTIDTSPFNTGNWKVKLKNLSLTQTAFRLTGNMAKPVPGLFDEDHLDVKNISIQISDLNITGDTIHANLNNMTAQDRCGIVIKKMRSKVSVSPIATICDELYLETGYSKVQRYYAMHYKRFPCFLNYIDSVSMVAQLKDAVVDARDIAYFAPQLKNLNMQVHASGEGRGTVANLSAHNLNITDGYSMLKGNVTMEGLPDIYKTYITFTGGELMTTGGAILKYAPMLKNDSNIALSKLQYAYFTGSYKGYIENFSVNGVVNTNLGKVTASMAMSIPGFNSSKSKYSGTIAATGLQLGTLLNQPMLGAVTLKEDVSGTSFDPANAVLNIDGNVSTIGINGYTYQKLLTHGTLAQKHFNGTLLVDDPNLALEFKGAIDYTGKEVNIKAKANLLNSNFKAMNLTADTTTLAADFDLDCTGSNIDNFHGYAKLDNIDIRRNYRRLAIDSILVNATGDSSNKLLTVQSNALTATVKGDYQLSKMPASFQYYLSRYIPNYISAPVKYAPAQNLSFTIHTNVIDSILAVLAPAVRGFDTSVISGSLNTTTQKLSLTANVPYGSVGNVHMNNIAISGQGNLDLIGLSANVDNVVVGDSMLSGSLSLTTFLANDSLSFTVATTSPDSSSALTLKGEMIARKDSLFLSMLPSQFYLSKTQWDIAGGSRVVYSDKYLQVQGLTITSGLQKITAATQLERDDRSLVISTENLDLGQLGNWAGLAAYQPDGRVNGNITIDKIFSDLYISANLKATGVKMGADTVGTVTVIGTYDGAKKLITLDPQTGIYRDNASIAASGRISFDTTTHQQLDGSITFNNAPVSWASPFMAGIMSHMSGVLNGSVGFGGTAYNPDISGNIALTNAGFRLDYLGCNYTIPSANITIDNRRINIGDITMLDSHGNTAYVTGHFSHKQFNNMRMHITARSDKFEVMNTTSADNNVFYGQLTASMDSFVIKGPFNNLKMNVYNAAPAEQSHLYIPISQSGEVGTYSYVTFKNYGKNQGSIIKRNKDKMHIGIDANLNDLCDVTIVMDPTTGDNITARGEGNISLEIPPDNDMRINGTYTVDEGTYGFTFKQLEIKRQFKLKEGGTIRFNGPFNSTILDVDAIYATKARLYDLLSSNEAIQIQDLRDELSDAQTPQWVDVILHMDGTLVSPKLTFDLDLEEKHSYGTIAYGKLAAIKNDDRQKFDQAATLLLVNDFVPPDGPGSSSGSAVTAGAINNISQIVSGTLSPWLSGIVNKILGDKDLNVAVKYTNYNYNYADQGNVNSLNRSQVKLDVNKSYLNNRLVVEVGGTSDIGRSTTSSSNASGFNITGDFRIQYQLSQASSLRLNAFRTSDYDVTLDRDIVRTGVGITWRRTFDNLGDFFESNKEAARIRQEQEKKLEANVKDTTTVRKAAPAGETGK